MTCHSSLSATWKQYKHTWMFACSYTWTDSDWTGITDGFMLEDEYPRRFDESFRIQAQYEKETILWTRSETGQDVCAFCVVTSHLSSLLPVFPHLSSSSSLLLGTVFWPDSAWEASRPIMRFLKGRFELQKLRWIYLAKHFLEMSRSGHTAGSWR